MTILRPSDAKQVSDAVAWAAAERQALEVVAGGSKRALGRPMKAEHMLDVSQIAGVVNYEPAELILTAKPATPMAAIKAELQAKRQMLAFEPPDWRGLMGTNAEPTLGGALACNLAGSRRVRAGAARDFFLGFSAVNGAGEIWKAGGKVVKNVTGYDMMKLMAGSFGTLSVLTEVTLKVTPRPEIERTILLHALADEVAVAAMAKALNTPLEVSSVAHLPSAAARRSRVAEVAEGLGAVTAIRLEGPAPSVAYRAEAIEGLFGHGARLDDTASARLWEEVSEVHRLLPPNGRVMWRLCSTPSVASALVNNIRTLLPSAEALFDWGGGLIWLSLDSEEAGSDAGAAVVRAAMKPHGGHATLLVAPDSTRERVSVFEPAEGPLAELTARIKNGFDPVNVLNPGRMQENR
jgi:glycolate oxidase FAD binding subunit